MKLKPVWVLVIVLTFDTICIGLVMGVPIFRILFGFLAGQLIFVALLCIVFGVFNSLITWLVEERLYRMYKT
ncbi:MAG: hypothetical protein WAV05_04395 [Anaerolineales bacterium]